MNLASGRNSLLQLSKAKWTVFQSNAQDIHKEYPGDDHQSASAVVYGMLLKRGMGNRKWEWGMENWKINN